MTRIFYYATDVPAGRDGEPAIAAGTIYGTYPGDPSGNTRIQIPAGIAGLDVADPVVWPGGSEKWSRVNPITRLLEAIPLTVLETERRQTAALSLPTFAEIDALVDQLFPGLTDPQRTFLKRLAKLVRALMERVA